MIDFERGFKLLKEHYSLKPGDVIYIVRKTKILSSWKRILNLLMGGDVSLYYRFKDGALRYLVATDPRGVICNIDNAGGILEEAEIEKWSPEMKQIFKKTEIAGVRYNKIRKEEVRK